MSDDDFRKQMGDVKHLRQDTLPKAHRKPTLPQATFSKRRLDATNIASNDNIFSLNHIEPVEPGAVLSFKVPGLQQGVFKKLRLGKYPIEARLDLHKRSVAEASQDVHSFLKQCLKYQLRTIIITHGKGEKSNPPAVLKSCINKWLRQVNAIQAFHSCMPRHGGTGSVYVLLAKSMEQRIENREKHNKR